MSIAQEYIDAMVAGLHGKCARIEQQHGLYGYPPEIVSVGLAAADEGRDAEQAVMAYMGGDDHAD